jgi:hypothetical protein
MTDRTYKKATFQEWGCWWKVMEGHVLVGWFQTEEEARLSCASRELLEALETMHAHHVRDGTVPAGHSTGTRPETCYACAVIAKARGTHDG